jgi:hypothetical protein
LFRSFINAAIEYRNRRESAAELSESLKIKAMAEIRSRRKE